METVYAVPEKELGSGVEGEPGNELLEIESNVRLRALPDLAESNVYRTGHSAHGMRKLPCERPTSMTVK